jgi:ribosomal protein S18 acetylase RimI-like enzyme
VSYCASVPDLHRLAPREWRRLRELRLSALRDSPNLFLHTFEDEVRFRRKRWRAEFDRGTWHVWCLDGVLIGLIGVTHETETKAVARYIEYVWVAPSHRRAGIASRMLAIVLNDLRAAGIRTALLWVLDGNAPAIRLYERVGFVRTNVIQPIVTRPGRREEQLKLVLALWRTTRPGDKHVTEAAGRGRPAGERGAGRGRRDRRRATS